MSTLRLKIALKPQPRQFNDISRGFGGKPKPSSASVTHTRQNISVQLFILCQLSVLHDPVQRTQFGRTC